MGLMQPRKHRGRRWALIVVLMVLAGVVGSYAYLTHPARLHRQVLARLNALPGVEVSLGHVEFRLPGTLRMRGLRLSPEGDNLLYRHLEGGAVPPLLQIEALEVRCDPLELLSGKLAPMEIAVDDARVAIVYDPARAPGEPMATQARSGARLLDELLRTGAGRLPEVRLTDGDLRLMVVEQGQPRLFERFVLQGVGKPLKRGYSLTLDRRPVGPLPLVKFEWREQTAQLALGLDWADLETVRRMVPARVAALLDELRLRGRAQLDLLLLDTRVAAGPDAAAGPYNPITTMVLKLEDISLELPVEEAVAKQRGERYLRLTEAKGVVNFDRPANRVRGGLHLVLNGRLRGADAKVEVVLTPEACQRLLFPQDEAERALRMDDVRVAEVQVRGLELPTPEMFPAFVDAPRLPGPLAASLRDYRPRGRIAVRLRLLEPAAVELEGASGVRLEGEVEALGASCVYQHFPYEFEDVVGKVVLRDGQMHLENICGRHGSARACATGVINNNHPWTGFDLVFRGENVALNSELYAALPLEYQTLWQQAAPLGVCEVVTHVRRAEGSEAVGPREPEVQVDARLQRGSLLLGRDGRMEEATGWLHVADGVVHVRDLEGFLHGGRVRLDGQARLVEGGTHVDLRVAACDLPLAQEASFGLGEEQAPTTVAFGGRADVWGRVHGVEEQGGIQQHMVLHLKEGQLYGLDRTAPWLVEDGWVNVRGGQHDVLSFECRQGPARLTLKGAMPEENSSGTAVQMELSAQTPTVSTLYPQFLPPSWCEIVDTFGLSGPGNVSVRLYGAQTDPAASAQAAHIQLRAGQMRPTAMPLVLRVVDADLTLSPGQFRLHEATAEWGAGATIAIRQDEAGTWRDGSLQADFAVTARNLMLTPTFTEAMPAALARMLERLAARGQFDLLLSRLHVRGAQEKSWRLEGTLPFRNAALSVGLELTDLVGQLRGVCNIHPDGQTEILARFAIETGLLAGRPIARWDGRLFREEGQRWVRVDELSGQLCGGVAQGAVSIDPESGVYELVVKLHDVRADELFPPRPDQPTRRQAGLVDGDIWLRGVGSDPATRDGGGTLRLRGGSFLGTPVLESVKQAQEQKQAISDTVDQADIRFLWLGRELKLQRVEIQSQDLRMIGEGVWNLRDDTIRMTLVGAHPRHWPRLPGLTDLLESAGRELVQYHVTGTLSRPKVTAEPLYKLNEALRKLLGGSDE